MQRVAFCSDHWVFACICRGICFLTKAIDSDLQDMGFGDRPANIRALQAVSGNVNAAVERLLSGL